MKLNPQKILGFFAVFVTCNIVLNSIAPIVILADTLPTSYTEQTITPVQEEVTYSITGHKYSQNEVGLPYWDIVLYSSVDGENWTYASETTTKDGTNGELGSYVLDSITAGTYDVCEVNSPNWSQIQPDAQTGVDQPINTDVEPYCFRVVIPENSEQLVYGDYDFINENIEAPTTGTITVTKDVVDQNNVGEGVYSDNTFTVRLEDSEGTPIESFDSQMISDSSVSPLTATFTVESGTYQIVEDPVEGFTSLGCNIVDTETNMITVQAGSNVNVVCTNQEQPVVTGFTISGYKYGVDTMPYESYVGISGWDIVLYKNAEDGWHYVADSTTAADGSYIFPTVGADYELSTGTYDVCEINTIGWEQIYPNIVTGSTKPINTNVEHYCFQVVLLSLEHPNFNGLNFLNYHNLQPAVSIYAFPGSTTTAPNKLKLKALGAGGNGALTYSWVCNNSIKSNSVKIALATPDTYNCTVTVTDEDGDTASASTTVTIHPASTSNNIETGSGSEITTTSSSGTDNSSSSSSGSIDEGTTTSEDGISNDVLGLDAQVCTTKSAVSGYVFIDTNGNNSKEFDEDGIADVEVTIIVNVKDDKGQDQQVELRTLRTNALGRWDTSLCPGEYIIKANTNDLPDNAFLGGSDNFNFTVQEGVDKDNVNFAAYLINGSTSINFNWWILLIPLVIILLAAGGYAIFSTSRRNS